jgi:hypothetical protein
LDLQTDCGLRHVQAIGSTLKTALSRDGFENAKLIQGKGQVRHGYERVRGGAIDDPSSLTVPYPNTFRSLSMR